MPLTPGAVRGAIEAAFPALAVAGCRSIGEGWDSAAWLVNGALLFRFLKRPAVARALGWEIALLPALAPTLPVAIPHFTYVAQRGAPTDPALPFVGYPLLPASFSMRYRKPWWRRRRCCRNWPISCGRCTASRANGAWRRDCPLWIGPLGSRTGSVLPRD